MPRVTNFAARFHGRIRGGANKPWMTFTGEQVNTYGREPSRLFFMDATMFGLPVDVLHVYVGHTATMRVKVCSVIPMVNAAGPDLDKAETVTLFNDMCVLAPAALVDANVVWEPIDDRHVRGTFTNGAQTVDRRLDLQRRPRADQLLLRRPDEQPPPTARPSSRSGGRPRSATTAPSAPAGWAPPARAAGMPRTANTPTWNSTWTRSPTTSTLSTALLPDPVVGPRATGAPAWPTPAS